MINNLQGETELQLNFLKNAREFLEIWKKTDKNRK